MTSPPLSPWQRLVRKWKLMGGSYTHPDGHIELDFEEPAGITRFDDEETQTRKLVAYEQRQAAGWKNYWYFLAGAAFVYVLLKYH